MFSNISLLSFFKESSLFDAFTREIIFIHPFPIILSSILIFIYIYIGPLDIKLLSSSYHESVKIKGTRLDVYNFFIPILIPL